MTTTASTTMTSLPRKVVANVPSSKHPVSALAAYKARLNKPTADNTPTAAGAAGAATVASINTSKRVAHTTTSNSKPTGPPAILPNIRSKIPIKDRQQEAIILNSTANLAGYKQKAVSILGNLKKRPVSTGPEDVGIDGEWKDPALKQNDLKALLERLDECTIPLDGLQELGYPLPDLLHSAKEESKVEVGSQAVCDRCQKVYVVKDILDKSDAEVCLHHPRRMKTVLVNGEKKRVYRCCEDALESIGCARGPHVYKEDNLNALHNKIPFIRAPAYDSNNTNRRKLVALDCEMGYTTAGMELIRLTVVDEEKNMLLDELVLPSNMVIDLNTQFSGVKTLEGVKHDLFSLRKELFKYVDQDTVIVGHGLENDMCALRLIHTKIVDTVALFPHKAGLPYRNSLRTLASAITKKFIQEGSDGHDSLEDASICIDLLKEYIKRKK
ncbi:hypothetical protein G6F54_003556 [Rhizopus delemar]|nr:hypothetical protein G6F54_003556 [Rhizopus delemar]KAG1639891.1 hypothetical protein G6F44_007382 [Rhizopus delemar]